MRLYNTLTRRTEDFAPAKDGVVGLYTCGPTVYNYLHVGNYRTYVFEDALKRALRLLGFRVRHVMNVTDVGHLVSDQDEGEDKLEVGAAREGKSAREIAGLYEHSFFADIGRLRIDFQPVPKPARKYEPKDVDIVCRATEHIEEQKRMVDRLTERGVTYETSDGIYFDTSKFPDYGALCGGAHMAGLQEGARVQANPEKRNASDFALWKFSPKDKKRHMEWEYRGRMGFPGWHIECSAMGQTYLGDTFDIHCGGVDHIPVHHTNEIAQAEAATGKKPFVRFWLHAEFLVVNKAKMAKSAGGFITLPDLEKKGYHALDYRFFCFGAHYRRQLDFSWEGMDGARSARSRLKGRADDILREAAGVFDEKGAEAFLRRLRDRLADDLDMPGALATVWDAVKPGVLAAPAQAAFLREAEKVLALSLCECADRLPAELQSLFDRYVESRAKKDYKSSDVLRKELAEKGVRVKDTPKGSVWSLT